MKMTAETALRSYPAPAPLKPSHLADAVLRQKLSPHTRGEDGNSGIVGRQAAGEYVSKQRPHNNRHRASPLFADGHLYLTARDGRVTVVKAGRDFEIIARNDLGEPISASPVIADGTLYLRTFDALWAIRSQP